MKSSWEYIGGHQWSLVDRVEDNYDEHVCSVEIERGKHPSVAYVSRELTNQELEELLTIVFNKNV